MSGGLLLCWKNIHLVVLEATKNIIYTRIKLPIMSYVFCTFIYGHPTTQTKNCMGQTLFPT